MSWFKKFLPLGEERRQDTSFGFQVLKNTNKFIAIEPWFDFICGINGRLVEDGNSYLFSKEIENCAGRDVAFSVWSAKGQRMRDVMVSVPSSSLSLGLTLQWCPVSTTEDIWHILDVAANSPADYAGLLPYSDYIIGTPEGLVRGESALEELVQDHMDRPLRLYVYNHEYDVTRELHITPTRSWGGEGAMGCVLGFGALHRIPLPLHEPVQGPEPGNLIMPAVITNPSYQFTPMDNPAFRGTSPGAHLFSAAKSGTPPPPRSTSSPVPARHKARHARDFDTNLMDDYLREGEQKSRELEGNRSSPAKINAGLPPPPRRAGQPPRKAATPVPQPDQVKPEGEDELD
ncbi:GRASP55/65 PDZ-like domain-containing protein [Trichophaea hybrida]|nr:GRASP55/65 PDZ-like domain-containing protein [Trichophaea hybrida]